MLCLLALRLLSAKSTECIAVACSSGFPLPASSGLLPARPTHALRTCYVCLLFDYYPLKLECIAVASSSGVPLHDSSGLLPARPTHALQTCYVCLLFDFYPLNCIAVACSSGFPLPANSRLLPARPTHYGALDLLKHL